MSADPDQTPDLGLNVFSDSSVLIDTFINYHILHGLSAIKLALPKDTFYLNLFWTDNGPI